MEFRPTPHGMIRVFRRLFRDISDLDHGGIRSTEYHSSFMTERCAALSISSMRKPENNVMYCIEPARERLVLGRSGSQILILLHQPVFRRKHLHWLNAEVLFKLSVEMNVPTVLYTIQRYSTTIEVWVAGKRQKSPGGFTSRHVMSCAKTYNPMM